MWLLQVVTGVELRGALDFARCQRLSVQCVLLSMSVQFVRSSMVIIGRLSGLILQRAQQSFLVPLEHRPVQLRLPRHFLHFS